MTNTLNSHEADDEQDGGDVVVTPPVSSLQKLHA